MPNEKQKKEKLLSIDSLRHTEYYGLQGQFDELYAKSKNDEEFTDLMPLILSRENILLAYRNIKTNTGSKTAGTDHLTIDAIGKLTAEQVVEKIRYIVAGSPHGYRPKPVRRKDIPKPYDPGKTRPLGIPCIWDRLIQQCIKQVMEPICEAKFSDYSYGFRPNRSAEHAIAKTYQHIQRSHLHFVVEFDIKGFFDNVNHRKLIQQIWAMGIHDTHLIYVLRKILQAPIKMPDRKMVMPQCGTPQGGIISPLLANIVLNELDHWIESQWMENPVCQKYSRPQGSDINRSGGYKNMRKTELKEMYIVRYADDFRIFCRTRNEAQRTKIAVTQWLSERLKLEVSPEKTRVVNVKRQCAEFLGFKIKAVPKGGKYVVKSHIRDKQLDHAKQKLKEQAKRVARPPENSTERQEINRYNSMVMGIQNYYRIATCVNLDCDKLNRFVMTIFTNRLRTEKGTRLVKHGRKLTETEQKRFGKTKTMRYAAGSGEPIYPIGYVQCKNPMNKRRSICAYTVEGRKGIHDNLRINVPLMLQLMRQSLHSRSAEYADNRISLFSAQWGKCAVTGKEFQILSDIHCHHIVPRKLGGSDKYENLLLVLEPIHNLIHATQEETIQKYLKLLNLDKLQVKKLNDLREKAGLNPVC